MKLGKVSNKMILTMLFPVVIVFLLLPAIATEKGSAKKGKEIFESLTCVDCHQGGENSIKPGKPIKGEKFAKKYKKDSQIEQLIRKGVYGSSMPGFGKDIISDAQMIDLIAYIRSLTPEENKGKGTQAKKEK